MPKDLIDDKSFYVGICMAGAVSAGAYTAGVMDYLIEALEKWDKRKKAGVAGTPSHNVIIPVLGGASAGGMTAIVTAAALNNQITPVKEPFADLLSERPENKLYHTWVDLLDKDMLSQMLETSDLKSEGIVSILNSSFIDKLAERAIRIDKKAWRPYPTFFHPNLKIFATLTNLQGFSYNVAFKAVGEGDKYYMAIHNDYACFKMNSDSEVEDGWMNLDFKNDINTKVAKDAAMATGAFPVGLKSRRLKRKSAHVNKIIWDRDVTGLNPVSGEDCNTLNVDGGVINNEPFEKVRDVLDSITGETKEESQNDKTFRSTVLLIDPFPSKEPSKFNDNQKLFNVVGLTLTAILEQMRAKPEKLAAAMDVNCPGQFLIAPTRRIRQLNGVEKEVAGDKAIACGALAGFSGFVEKEFRVHDYFLGRFNCEMFLRNYFTISEEAINANPIFKEGYAGIDKSQFKGADGNYQVIPIFSPLPAHYFPIPTFSNGSTWPVVNHDALKHYRPLIKIRVQSLIMNAIQLKWFNKIFVWIGSKVVLRRVITNAIMKSMKKSLNEHQLLQLDDDSLKEIKEEAN